MQSRPKRIWAICFMLIIIPVMSLTLSSYLLITNNIPEGLELTNYNLSIMFIMPLALIFSSVMFFLGKANSHRYVLSISTAYFGILIYQNLYLLHVQDLAEDAVTKITTNVVRSVIELLLVIWVVFSAKTKAFMSKNV